VIFTQPEPHLPARAGHRGERLEHRHELAAPRRELLELGVDRSLLLGRRLAPLLPDRPLGRFEGGRRRGMHGHGRVAEQRLGPRCGHGHARRLAGLRVHHVVADVPEVPLHLLVKDLVVTHGRLQEGVPVDEPLAPPHEALLKETQEGRTDGPRALLVERETRAVPIAARTEVAELAEDPLLVLLLPAPDPLHEPVAAEVVAGEFLLLEQPPLHHRLCGDARMVGAGHPERETALHPPGPH
jgi:hypothetical protein